MVGTFLNKVVNILPPADYNNSTMTSDIVSMKGYDHCTIILNFGATNTNAATTTNLIVYKGENVTTCTTATPVRGYRIELDATADTLGVLTAMPATGVSLGVGNTEDIGTGGGFMVVEIDAENLEPTIGNPYDTVKVSCVWADATSCILGGVAVLSKPRYAKAAMPTAITN